MYYLYVLKSKKDCRLYTGITSDIDKRLKYHNSGKCRSTKTRRPLELIFKEEFSNKREARKRELFFKSGVGRKVLKAKLAF